MRQRARRLAALFVAAAIAFAQLAMSAYACAGPATPPGSPSMQAMEGCGEMGSMPASPLCASHCSEAAQSLDKPASPAVPPAAFLGVVAWMPVSVHLPQRVPAGPRTACAIPPPEPPLAITHCCLRI